MKSWTSRADQWGKALWCWAEEFGPRSRKFVQNRTHLDIISELIYELTGQKICRKLVSSHIQALKDFFRDSHSPWAELVADIRNQFCQGKVRESETVKTDPASKVRNYRPARPSENTTLSIRNYDSVLSVAIQLKDSLSLHRSTPFAQDLLSLSLVNRLYRTECLHHLASSLHFDFGLDNRAFQRFCSTTPTEFLKVMHLSVSLVEGYMPDLPTLPNLHALAIDLWPRKPTRRNREDRAWGPQTEKLLAALGVEVAAGARISLEMRWAADYERFEREYVGKGRRGRVIGDEGNDAPDPERVFTCRRYEFRGNGWIVVGGTREDEDEEVAFPDVGFVSSG